jgi:hypothetical protein
MWLPTKGQVDAASRHAITAAGVAVTIFGLQAKGVSMEQVTALISSLGETVNTILQVVAAAGVLYGGIKAANSASPTNRIADVRNLATGAASADAVAAQSALIEATAAVAQDHSIPASVDAKNTLIAATIALPEVQTIVTDKKTADASPSPSVISVPLARVS